VQSRHVAEAIVIWNSLKVPFHRPIFRVCHGISSDRGNGCPCGGSGELQPALWLVSDNQWLYTLRIEEAKQIILRNPGVKISEVASAVGIPIIYNFSRWFKSITGMTAVTWRNMCRAEIAEKSENFLQDNCQMWGKCGENRV
jgi:AraC-like DNA-binding protein